jgi:hypothetical protein
LRGQRSIGNCGNQGIGRTGGGKSAVVSLAAQIGFVQIGQKNQIKGAFADLRIVRL